jgi:hypothetical protein
VFFFVLLPVPLDCPFVIIPAVFSNVYFHVNVFTSRLNFNYVTTQYWQRNQ